MPNKQELLSVVSDNGLDYEKLLLLLFSNYEAKKKNGSLYSMKEFDPQGLIKIYYRTVDKPKFDILMEKFRMRYIRSESQLEQVHERCEREGLGAVYDYVQSDIIPSNINVFAILKLHTLLYSHAPYPEFGGKFRNRDVYLPGTGIPTECWDNIPRILNTLYQPFNELVQEGLTLGQNKNVEEIIPYINRCLQMKTELVRIHPFMDGNGRVMRALINILFKIANIPLVYVKPEERAEYQQAMTKAINEKDFQNLYRFYYYKICDSIYELDVQEKIQEPMQEKSK